VDVWHHVYVPQQSGQQFHSPMDLISRSAYAPFSIIIQGQSPVQKCPAVRILVHAIGTMIQQQLADANRNVRIPQTLMPMRRPRNQKDQRRLFEFCLRGKVCEGPCLTAIVIQKRLHNLDGVGSSCLQDRSATHDRCQCTRSRAQMRVYMSILNQNSGSEDTHVIFVFGIKTHECNAFSPSPSTANRSTFLSALALSNALTLFKLPKTAA